MLEEAKKFTKEHHMIEEGSRVIAGVSGGADSVCLPAPSVRTAKRNAV